MEKILIFCGIPVVLVVASVSANILTQRAFPSLDGDNFGPHECGIVVKMFVLAIVMGLLGPTALGHIVAGGLK